MKIQPKSGILLIKKHKRTGVKVDMVIEEMDEDKRLITGEILSEISPYNEIMGIKKGDTVIFGKYAIFPLTLQGENFFLLDQNDILGICDYKE